MSRIKHMIMMLTVIMSGFFTLIYAEELPLQEEYRWLKYEDHYTQGGNLLHKGYYSSLQKVMQFAESMPEISAFFYVDSEHGVWDIEGMDYASDHYQKYPFRYAEFYSGSGGHLYEGEGASTYVKRWIDIPANYTKHNFGPYIKEYTGPKVEIAKYIRGNISLENAFKDADKNPEITHFFDIKVDMIVYNPYSGLKKQYNKGDKLFFKGALPLSFEKYYDDYGIDVIIYSKDFHNN